MNNLKIYYNPSCSKCRQTKSLIKEKNIDVDVIEYLNTTPTKDDLMQIINLGVPAKDMVRTGENEWAETELNIETASTEDLLEAIIQHPILLQRPIVLANGKVVIARPPEKVLEIL